MSEIITKAVVQINIFEQEQKTALRELLDTFTKSKNLDYLLEFIDAGSKQYLVIYSPEI